MFDLFHHFFPVVREYVWHLVEDSCYILGVLTALNATFLAFIPKQERVLDPKNFCPIAFCDVIYKIITKVISCCLKPLLPLLISLEKTNYVEGQ
jgi:hypothetical protein